jgi:hypothetical protein
MTWAQALNNVGICFDVAVAIVGAAWAIWAIIKAMQR